MTHEINDGAVESIPNAEPLGGDAVHAEVAEVRADIEETRLEMGGTLNELGERLEPKNLIDQAKENVREATVGRVEETARGVSDMVFDTIKRNPIPAAMAGMGLAMLWKNRSQEAAGQRVSYGTDYGYTARPSKAYSGERTRDMQSRVGDAASTVVDATSTVSEAVGGAVGTVAKSAQEATGQVADRAGATAEQVGWKLESFMQANPMAMGAIAAGVGAVMGSLLPETDQEREILGDASRQVSAAVSETVEQATAKAEETFDRAQDKVD